MTANRSDKRDPPAALGKCSRPVKGQGIHGDNLGRGSKRDAVPAQQACDFQILWAWQQADQDQIRWLKQASII